MTDDLNGILPSIKVYEFPEIKTEFNRSTTPFTMVRVAFLKCPVCKGVDDFYNCKEGSHYQAYYCPGNQPPEQECRDFLGNSHTHPTSCAGIRKPHFHVKCICCQQVFYLESCD